MDNQHATSDFATVYNLLQHYAQLDTTPRAPTLLPAPSQAELHQRLEAFLQSSRYQRVANDPHTLPALQLLCCAAILLQQLQHSDPATVLRTHHAHLLRLAELPLEADPLGGVFYHFVAQLAHHNHDTDLAALYHQRHTRYQADYALNTVWQGLEELHYDSSLLTLLDTQPATQPATQPSPTFVPPTYQDFSYQPISNPATHRIMMHIVQLQQGQAARFQAGLVQHITPIPQHNRLELNLNLEPETQAIPLLRYIEDALWKLRFIFSNGTVDIASSAIYQQETSLNRLRVVFEVPRSWLTSPSLLARLDGEALWQSLSTIILSVDATPPKDFYA